jgi:hypothetical protein
MAGQLFPIGVLTATPAALAELERAGVDILVLVARHSGGDYGIAMEDGVRINQETIQEKVGTILSIYPLTNEDEIWVATSLQEAGEAHTCVLCPNEW